uniref:Uncharacterized protein n=1 Tax=Lotharella oceanica TaxID=641309 RepID=A0A7S2TY19_9EUKA|mmetsp:Transcript_35044/g.64898  ORF Transcript_35044/g.64898 Transcript_35044/m.64898 type:complete len:237 (+) Transcript_35044:688-1398(+)
MFFYLADTGGEKTITNHEQNPSNITDDMANVTASGHKLMNDSREMSAAIRSQVNAEQKPMASPLRGENENTTEKMLIAGKSTMRMKRNQKKTERLRRSVCVLTSYLVGIPTIILLVLVWFLATSARIVQSSDDTAEAYDKQSENYNALRDFGDWIFVLYFLLAQFYTTPDDLLKLLLRGISSCCCCCDEETVSNFFASTRVSTMGRNSMRSTQASLQMRGANAQSKQPGDMERAVD